MSGEGRGAIIVVGLLYFVVCAVIAAWAARRTTDSAGFFLARRGVGIWAMAIASMATSLSGFAFIGGPGLMYARGLGAVYIILPAAVTGTLTAWVVGRRLRLLAAVRPLVTMPEVVGARYRSIGARRLAGVAVVIATVGYVATNFLALGLVLEAVFGLDRVTAIVIGAAVVVAYSASGGMLAGVYTDVFQGSLMAVASLLVFGAAVQGGGGLAAQTEAILAADPAWFGPWGGSSPMAALSFFFIFGIGTLGQPQLLHKFFMLRDPARLRWYPALMTGAMLVTLMLFVGVGIAMKAAVVTGTVGPLTRPDDATATFLLRRTPVWLTALVMSGVIAAIMSTVNSFLNLAAAALTRDIPRRLTASDAVLLRRGRVATVLVALLALALALGTTTLVALLGVFGWGLFASSLVPALALGLLWEGATRAGAIASMTVATLGTLGLETAVYLHRVTLPAGVNAAALMLVLSLLTFLGVSWLTREHASRDLDPDVRLVMRR